MAPSFTLKSLSVSPSRPSLPLAVPSANVSPLSSPGRSPTSYFPLPSPSSTSVLTKTQPSHRLVNRDEAFKVVKYLEEVLSAWNEYRMALAQAGKAGKKLASAMKELAGCMDKTDVPAQTIKPAGAMIETSSELLGKLSKKVDGMYDQANADASKYFNLLAKESRSHDAYLNAATKKHDKAEKAYRKASKSLGESATAHSGLVTLKTSLSEDIARANADQAMLFGSKQADVVLKMASAIGGLAVNLSSFFSEGLRKVAISQPDVEYFRALADIHWLGSIPRDLDEAEEEKKRDEVRLIKTRVALGEMDIVGEKVWRGLAKGPNESVAPEKASPQTSPPATNPSSQPATAGNIPTAAKDLDAQGLQLDSVKERPEPDPKPTPANNKPAPSTSEPSPPPTRNDPPVQTQPAPAPRLASQQHSPPEATHNAHSLHATITSTGSSATLASSGNGSEISLRHAASSAPDAQPRRDLGMSTVHYPTLRSLPQSPERQQVYHPQQARPPVGPRNVSMPGQAVHMGHAPRRSVSQIARDMERHAVNERHSTFEAHQGHRSFVSGCSLCSMDYDRMVQMRQQQASRRVIMPPAYSQPQPLRMRDERDEADGQSVRYSDERRDEPSPWHRAETQDRRSTYYASSREHVLQAPQPRRATGHSPDFAVEERSF